MNRNTHRQGQHDDNSQQLLTFNRHIAPPRSIASAIKIACLLGAMFAAATVHAAEVTVDTLGDGIGNADDNHCTLREAVIAINNGADDPADCVADITPSGYGSNDRVDATGMSGDIVLATHIQIAKDMKIVGSGPGDLSLHGAGTGGRIFVIVNTANAVTLKALTLTDGKTTDSDSDPMTGEPGGAIRSLSSGKLTLFDCIVTGNATEGDKSPGGAVYAEGAVDVVGCTVSGNSTQGTGSGGGALRATGKIKVVNSTVTGNSTTGEQSAGGALVTTADGIEVSKSTISNNSTTGLDSEGGALFAIGDIKLVDSTLSGNSTAGNDAPGGGAYTFGGDISVFNSTVSGNFTQGTGSTGGGLHTTNNISLINSTIAYNFASNSSADGVSAPAFGDIEATNSILAQKNGEKACSDPFDPASSHNMVANPGGDDVSCGVDNLPVLSVTTLSALKLGTLADNGGDTQTHALFKDSVALEAGNITVCTSAPISAKDQRGSTRPKDGDGDAVAQCDIGSFEAQGVPPPMPSDGGGGGGSSGSGGCALSGHGHNSLGWLVLLLGGGLLWRWRHRQV